MRRTLVQMAGHAGSGKSTLARRIARHTGGVVIDLDTIKSALLDAGADWDEASSWSYSVLYALVDDALGAAEVWVVVDTPSYWPQIHERLTAAADRSTAAYVFLECEADEEARADRLARRRPSRSQVRGLARRPADAPEAMRAPHLRPIQRPTGRACLRVVTDREVDVVGLLSDPVFGAPAP